MPPQELPRELGLIDAAAIVLGTVIGSGIFLVPNLVARSLPSATWMIVVWIFTGVVSFFGALTYAELGAMIPATGGQYVFLREAWGALFGFLCGWTYFFVVIAASIAWLGITFATYLSYFVPLSPWLAKTVAVTLIALVTLINYRGVRMGARVQKLFTLIKVAALAVLIGAALFGAHPAPAASAEGSISLTGFGAAMTACAISYDGWVALSFVAGEVKNPKRNLPLALVLGLGGVVAIYVLANVAYLRVLSVSEIAATSRVGALAAERAMGGAGGAFVSISILLSIVGAMNGWSITGPRIYFAQARDGLFFRRFAAIHPRFETPYVSIVLIGVWSALLALTGTYESLGGYAMFAAWVFYTLTTLGVIALRRAQPDRPRPYRVTGYPATPLIFALIAGGFVINTFVTSPGPAVIGALFIVSGVPAYFLWKRRA
jgi:APA family basic amino acid/polyamine antiporter